MPDTKSTDCLLVYFFLQALCSMLEVFFLVVHRVLAERVVSSCAGPCCCCCCCSTTWQCAVQLKGLFLLLWTHVVPGAIFPQSISRCKAAIIKSSSNSSYYIWSSVRGRPFFLFYFLLFAEMLVFCRGVGVVKVWRRVCGVAAWRGQRTHPVKSGGDGV